MKQKHCINRNFLFKMRLRETSLIFLLQSLLHSSVTFNTQQCNRYGLYIKHLILSVTSLLPCFRVTSTTTQTPRGKTYTQIALPLSLFCNSNEHKHLCKLSFTYSWTKMIHVFDRIYINNYYYKNDKRTQDLTPIFLQCWTTHKATGCSFLHRKPDVSCFWNVQTSSVTQNSQSETAYKWGTCPQITC